MSTVTMPQVWPQRGWARTPSGWLIGAAVFGCWLLVAGSLTQPAFLVDWPPGTTTDYPSVGIFFFGWLGVMSVLDGQFDMIGWLANPFFLFTSVWLISRKFRAAAVTGGLSVAFALSSLLLKTAIMNEAGHEGRIIAFALGFYLWLTAICVQAALAVALAWRRTETPASPVFLDE